MLENPENNSPYSLKLSNFRNVGQLLLSLKICAKTLTKKCWKSAKWKLCADKLTNIELPFNSIFYQNICQTAGNPPNFIQKLCRTRLFWMATIITMDPKQTTKKLMLIIIAQRAGSVIWDIWAWFFFCHFGGFLPHLGSDPKDMVM